MTDEGPRLRVVGAGPLRMPWERKRQAKSYDEAKAILRAADGFRDGFGVGTARETTEENDD